MSNLPEFRVITAQAVQSIVMADMARCEQIVAQAYSLYGAGACELPGSFFLRFRDNSNNRIIGLPCHTYGDSSLSGIKWIASYPGNVQVGLPRATAVIILNDGATGHPLACIEGSIISAVRTAASASLTARLLRPSQRTRRLAIVGTGMIARHVYAFLMGTGWDIPQVSVYDVHERAARAFADNVVNLDYHETVLVSANVESCLSGADLLVFATTAGSPYVRGPHTIEQDALILHLSLRDLDPEIVLGAYNVTDSTAHVLTADTSLHLAQKQVGHYEFIHAQIHELLDTRHQSAVDRPVIVSPFGLGVLDLELAQFVLRESNARGTSQVIPGFFLHDQGLRAWAEHP